MYFVLYLNTALGILIRLSSLFPTAMMCVFIFCVYSPCCLLPPLFFLIYINPSFPRPSASRPSCPSHLSSPRPLPIHPFILDSIRKGGEEEAEDEEGKERSTRGSACLPGEDISSLLELRARKRKKNSIGSVISRQHLRPEALNLRDTRSATMQRRL